MNISEFLILLLIVVVFLIIILRVGDADRGESMIRKKSKRKGNTSRVDFQVRRTSRGDRLSACYALECRSRMGRMPVPTAADLEVHPTNVTGISARRNRPWRVRRRLVE